LILAALLLCAQSHGLAHGLELDAHEPDETCELCLHLSIFDHASDIAGAVLVTALDPDTLPVMPVASSIRAVHTAFQARGPPSPTPLKSIA
jgi:hypothetical protein